MLNELLELAENVVVSIMIFGIVVFMLFVMLDFARKKPSTKKLLCVLIFATVSFSVLTQMVFQIYQTSLMWQTVEEQITVEPWIKTLSILTVEFFYSMFFILFLFFVLYIYKHQIIPGKGSIRNRIKHHWKAFVESLKIQKVKKIKQTTLLEYMWVIENENR